MRREKKRKEEKRREEKRREEKKRREEQRASLISFFCETLIPKKMSWQKQGLLESNLAANGVIFNHYYTV